MRADPSAPTKLVDVLNRCPPRAVAIHTATTALATPRSSREPALTHVQHHSALMPPEYYDACDEVGIMPTAEFPIAYESFLPHYPPKPPFPTTLAVSDDLRCSPKFLFQGSLAVARRVSCLDKAKSRSGFV